MWQNCGKCILMMPVGTYIRAELLQSCPTLCNSVDHSPPGSSVHGILQARILEWVPFPPPGVFPAQGSSRGLLCLLHWQAGSLSQLLYATPLLMPTSAVWRVSSWFYQAVKLPEPCIAPWSCGNLALGSATVCVFWFSCHSPWFSNVVLLGRHSLSGISVAGSWCSPSPLTWWDLNC